MFVYVFLTCFLIEAFRANLLLYRIKADLPNNGLIIFDTFLLFLFFLVNFLMLTCSLLTASLSAPTAAPSNLSPRGIKRSRSPDQYGDAGFDGGDHDDRTYTSIMFI